MDIKKPPKPIEFLGLEALVNRAVKGNYFT